MHPNINCLIALSAFLLFSASYSQAPRRNGRGTQMLRRRDPRNTGSNPNICAPLRFRTLSGLCTVPTNPTLGQAGLAQFSYIDGSSSRVPAGRNLRSARDISNIIFHQDGGIPNSRRINQLFVFFGQFLDHNLVTTPLSEPTEPMDIPVPRNDDHLRPGSTLPFSRSQRGYPRADADRPINVLSSAVDLVGVYGADEVRNIELQEYDRSGNPTGRLKVSNNRQNLLPRNENGMFNAPDTSSDFFLAGDHRANEHPALAAMHTLFVREHNSLARFVENAMPTLEKNLVYEFARKLNIAKYQKMVYEEFYPAIAGRPGQLSRYQGPRPNVNPTVSDIFAGAAFRVGHTMVGLAIPRVSRGLNKLRSIPVRDTFFQKADEFTNPEMENVLRGIASTVAQEVDVQIVDTLRNQLFENIPLVDGFDLISFNIQRGRDHNLPKFNEIRELFGLRRVASFGDFQCDPETRRRLRAAYDDVDDIEAFPGLLAESHVPGSSLGETMLAVWKEEFERLRDGDRFFYLNRDRFERSFPTGLQRQLRPFFRDLYDPNVTFFKDVVVENTEIRSADLPSAASIFRATTRS